MIVVPPLCNVCSDILIPFFDCFFNSAAAFLCLSICTADKADGRDRKRTGEGRKGYFKPLFPVQLLACSAVVPPKFKTHKHSYMYMAVGSQGRVYTLSKMEPSKNQGRHNTPPL